VSPPRHGSYPGADGPARTREHGGIVDSRPKGSPERRRRSPRPTDWSGVGTDLAHPRNRFSRPPVSTTTPSGLPADRHRLSHAADRFSEPRCRPRGPTDWPRGETEFLSRRRAVAPRGSAAQTSKKTAVVFYVCAGPKIRSGVGRAPPPRLFGGPHGPSARVAGGFKGVGSAGKRPLRAGPHGPSVRISVGFSKNGWPQAGR
jgi:hypothetical protein